MVSRTAFNQLDHSPLLLLCTIAGMVITYLAPPLLLLSSGKPAFFMGAAAWAAMTMTYSTMVRYYRLNPAWSLALPLAALFYLGATMHSAVKNWKGNGGLGQGRERYWGALERERQGRSKPPHYRNFPPLDPQLVSSRRKRKMPAPDLRR